MSFILGFIGALLCLALVVAGVFIGWVVRGKYEKNRRPAPVKASEEERAKLIAQQKAFRRVQNYTVEDAYGLNKSVLGEENS